MNDTPIIHAFKHIRVPLMIVGPDGAVLHCNRAANHLFGYDGDNLMGRPIFDVLPVQSVAELHAFIEAPSMDAFVKGMIGRNISGDPIPLTVQLTAWSDAENGLQHALVLRDITEDLKSDRLSKGELERANNAIRGARIGVSEYNHITNTVIVSDLWRELLEITGSDIVDVQEEWRSRVHPDDLDAALEPMKVCLEDISERASSEYRLRSRDGSRWSWMQTDVAIAKRDKTGRVIRLIGAMTDIGQRKDTENALRQSVERFKSSFKNAIVGSAIVDLDGKFLRVNSAFGALVGYSEDELLQTDFQSLTYFDDLNESLIKLDLLKAGKIPGYQMEKRYIRANGAVMWALVSVGMVKDAEGQPDHFISQFVDITELRRLDELRSEFVATVSHELRTPLTSVLGALALLSSTDDEPLSDKAQRLLYIAQENGKRLHALVNDILDFEKFSAQQMRFTLSQHQIAGLIEEAVLVNMDSADKYGVQFNIDCQDRSLTGFVDPQRFHQVMTNLLTNAAKFADKGSMIDVVVEGQANAIRVSIFNEGGGIPVAFRDKIFKPFSQAAPSSTRARGGTGLGLHITKQIVEQTGGIIGFESPKGGRTKFWFTVPINEPSK